MLFRAKKNHIKIAQFFSTKKNLPKWKICRFFQNWSSDRFWALSNIFPVQCVNAFLFSKMTHYLKNKIKFPFNVREKNLLFMWKSYLIIININFFFFSNQIQLINIFFFYRKSIAKWKIYWFIKMFKHSIFTYDALISRKKSEIYDDKKRRI